jgi:hypothetical protein
MDRPGPSKGCASLFVFSAMTLAWTTHTRRAAADEPLAIPVVTTPADPALAPSQGPRLPTVRAHLNASRPVTLEVLSPEELRWRPLCVAPCDADVPLEGVFRVVDHGMVPSGGLELEARPGDTVVLDVNARTYEQQRTGRRLTITGYIAGAVGLGLEVGALAVDSSSDAQPVLLWAGVGAAALAIACTISSYILLEPTNLSQSSASPTAPRVARETNPWARLPVWRESDGARGAAPTTNMPLFSLRF